MEGGGEVAEKMGFKYQWTMSPWTSGCIGVGCIVSNILSETRFSYLSGITPSVRTEK